MVDNGSNRSSRQLTESCWKVRDQMKKVLKAHQLDRLSHPGVPHQVERTLCIGALLGELHQGPKTGRVQEINLAEVDHRRKTVGLENVCDVGHELLFGIGIKLSGEVEHQTSIPLLEAASEGNGQSLQFADGFSSWKTSGREFSVAGRRQPPPERRSDIKVTNLAKWWSASWGPGLASGWY